MDDIAGRKADHIDITSQRPVTASCSPGWEDVHLVHQALPEIDFADVDLATSLLGHPLRAPLIIASMTGGHPRAEAVNRCLAIAAQTFGLAMGVGSQRAAIRRPELLSTYTVVREVAPDAFIIANIGAPQLLDQGSEPGLTIGQITQLVEVMGANALALHLNYLQEVVQPEGDTRARGVLAAVGELTANLPVPVIAKETGAGISRNQALRLRDAGVAALDVGGAGGTSFALVESFRAADRALDRFERLGQALGDWGIPTAASILECAHLGLPVIATGGIRSGLDAAKALALGANFVSLARPLLTAALEGQTALHDTIAELLHTLRTTMFLTGSPAVAHLHACDRVLTGFTADWLRARRV